MRSKSPNRSVNCWDKRSTGGAVNPMCDDDRKSKSGVSERRDPGPDNSEIFSTEWRGEAEWSVKDYRSSGVEPLLSYTIPICKKNSRLDLVYSLVNLFQKYPLVFGFGRVVKTMRCPMNLSVTFFETRTVLTPLDIQDVMFEC